LTGRGEQAERLRDRWLANPEFTADVLISTLGPDTLHELRAAWSTADDRIHVNSFVAQEALVNGVRRSGLTLSLFREENTVMRYRELRQLTRELKALGAHNVNVGRPAGLMSRQRLHAFSAAYETRRGADERLPATYQIYYLQLLKARM